MILSHCATGYGSIEKLLCEVKNIAISPNINLFGFAIYKQQHEVIFSAAYSYITLDVNFNRRRYPQVLFNKTFAANPNYIVMMGIYFILIGMAIFGFLPLAIILYKRNKARKILATGQIAKAKVYNVHTPRKSAAEIVYYHFITQTGSQSSGSLSTEIGRYKIGDVLDIYYMPGNPKQNTMHGAWESKGILIFGIAIAAFVLFAAYKLFEAVRSGSM